MKLQILVEDLALQNLSPQAFLLSLATLLALIQVNFIIKYQNDTTGLRKYEKCSMTNY